MSNAAPFHMQIQCRFNAAVIGQSEGVAGAKKLSARDFRVITWNCYRRKTPSQMPGPVPASASPRRQQMSYALRIVRNFESNQIRKQSINAERVSSLFSPSKFSNESWPRRIEAVSTSHKVPRLVLGCCCTSLLRHPQFLRLLLFHPGMSQKPAFRLGCRQGCNRWRRCNCCLA